MLLYDSEENFGSTSQLFSKYMSQQRAERVCIQRKKRVIPPKFSPEPYKITETYYSGHISSNCPKYMDNSRTSSYKYDELPSHIYNQTLLNGRRRNRLRNLNSFLGFSYKFSFHFLNVIIKAICIHINKNKMTRTCI